MGARAKPLQGRRVVVTRPRHQAPALAAGLRELGAHPLLCPTIEVRMLEDPSRLDAALRDDAPVADWIVFTSANGVRAVAERMESAGRTPADWSRARVAAIGPATAQAARKRGIPVDRVPDEYRAEAVATALGEVRGLSVLLLRADIARPALAEVLGAGGARVLEVPAYRTATAVPPALAIAQLRAGFDAVTFTSSSTARGFAEALGDEAAALLHGRVVASIGPVTSRTVRDLGFAVDVEAARYTTDGLLEALVAHLADHTPPPSPAKG